MSGTFYLTKGDTDPPVHYQGLQADGETPIPVQVGSVVKFWLRKRGAVAPKIDWIEAAWVDQTTCEMKYEWALDGTDTDAPGEYDARFRIYPPGGGQLTVPTAGSIDVFIDDI